MEKKDRKAFQHLPGNENPQFESDGLAIYSILRKKYPKHTVEDLDNILNALCASLTILMRQNVGFDDHKNFVQLIWNILNKNLEQK